MKYIKYIGEDVVLSENHSNVNYRGQKCLTKDTVYKLDFDWSGEEINGHWGFYIFDDIDQYKVSRGYEIKVSNIISLREINLETLINEN